MTSFDTAPVHAPAATRNDSQALPFIVAAAILFTVQLIIDAREFTGDAGAYWALSSAIIDGTFPQTIRGYAYPLLLTPFRLVFDHSQPAGLLFLKIGQSIGYAYAFSILIPNLYRSIFGAKLSTASRLIPSILIASVFPGLISYPLSDAPSLGLMALALYITVKSIRSKSFYGLFAAGAICYLTYNIRTIYLFSFIALAIVVTTFFAKDIQRRAAALTIFLAGSLLSALPQMAINYTHHATVSPLLVTDVRGASLFARQLTWGMVVDRYETYIDPGTGKATPTFYANKRGAAVLQKNGGFIANQSFTKILAMMANHPVTFAQIYLRHIASALDARDGEVYTKQPSADKNPRSVLFLIIVTFGITQLGKAIFFASSQASVSARMLHTLTLLAPCIAIIPGAIETRFFLPLYCLAYCALAFQQISRRALVVQLGIAAILTAGIYSFAADSVKSPIHARPESYVLGNPG
ncbi:hypothetical protein [Xanthomonas nasturtii]|uniref:Glycosyltransferase RgtA/B/C/D-like domain-containing protein n=1 Tax=Xanthomonas nasturtii TaxID=1843581 RepID=A0ABT0LR56_9XANT|nr:hypothetical protein [Xanthomonas nasturtii]MCL1499857.1 hypothetical protein [Xanthomonas nasturtii]MCL1503546.1 hypothetical protein [Xanthomonas nasturtii]MCL1523508.1 hypothetical protein [Xanthomonas nasturtii]MCL1551835.1 hypothetical protein [Xanthomonas nasturtii]MCL1556108.1 hypothetical protein [Xanthomonas nasturtii]